MRIAQKERVMTTTEIIVKALVWFGVLIILLSV